MKKKVSLWMAACLITSAVFTGCEKKSEDEPTLTKPVITFKDNVKEGQSPVTISATIVSDFDLKSVKVEKIFTDAANNEVVETITSFPNNPKELLYEREFTIPDGLVKMDVKITAVNVKDLSTEVIFTVTGVISITQADVVNVMAEAMAGWEVDGSFPEEFTIKGIVFTRAQMFGYAAQTLININSGQTASLSLLDIGACSEPDLDDYTTAIISRGALVDAVTRQLTYGGNNGVWANYASFGTYQGTPYTDEHGPYQGRFGFNRALVCLARILSEYSASGSLPATIIADYKQIAPYAPPVAGTFTREQLATAIAAAYTAAFDGSGNNIMPDVITVNGTDLSKMEYLYAAARLLLYINEDNSANIAVLTYLMPENPANDTYDVSTISVVNGAENGANTEDLINVVNRQIAFVTNKAAGNGYFSNYVSYTRGENAVYFSLNRTLVCLARAIAFYVANSTLPATVSTEYLPPVTTTIEQFMEAYVTILDDWEASGEAGSRSITNDFTKEANYVVYTKGNCFEAACRIIQAFDTNTELTLNDPLPNLSDFATSANPTIENSAPLTTPNDEGAEITMLINMVGRQLTYASANGSFANQVNYTLNQAAGYGGYCSLDRGMLIIARLFKHILDNDISENFKTTLIGVKVPADLQ
ncbi:MAG: hypothetical protein LBR08_10540 [Bacteroidales bacterium]|jgi:hypothetical protein|nr:hypothetical protein [Bacteroidales bacterium]